MKLNDEELEYLEGICMNDERYLNWIGSYNDFARDYDVPHSAVIWLESTMLVMLLGSVNIDKRFVFKTWNNGKSNEESYLVKKTTLELLENGDKEFFHLAEKTISWLRQDTEDYKFYGRLRKKRKKGEYEEIIEKCSEERSIGFIAAAPQEKYCSSSYLVKLERSVSCLVELCPMNEMGVVATLNLVTYYKIIHGGKLRNAVDFMKDRLNELHSKNIKYSDIECHFTNEQVRKSGISKEAEIVLAVIDYMLNGNFRQTYEYRYFSYPNCSADDFFVSIYSILYLVKNSAFQTLYIQSVC